MSRNYDGVDDKITAGLLNSYITNSSATLMAWVKPLGSADIITAVYDGSQIIGDSQGTGGFIGIIRGIIGGSDFIWAYNYDGSEDRVGVAYDVGVWTHFALVHIGGVLYLYKNGVEAGNTASGNTEEIGKTFVIGSTANNSNYFEGMIAYAHAFNVALTASEIKQLMAVPGSIRRGMTGFWPLFGMPIEYDLSGKGNHGTLTGTTIGTDNPPISSIFNISKPRSEYASSVTNAAPIIISPGINSRDFDGTDDTISFSAIAQTVVSIAGWVFVDSAGNSDFPRCLDTPAYQFYFGKDETVPLSGDDNTLKFGSIRTVDGVWNTPAGSLLNGLWYHVAVTYDSADTANDPLLYINGVSQTVAEQVLPVGAQASNVGTGYIGGNAANDRSLDGKVSNVSIFNRILSPNEIKQLMRIPGSIRGGLVGHYTLTGNAVEPDYSGAQRNGTVNGATLSVLSPPISGRFIVPRYSDWYSSSISQVQVASVEDIDSFSFFWG